MLVKPIDKPEKPKALTPLARIKLLFLVLGIGLGTFLVSQAPTLTTKRPVVSQIKTESTKSAELIKKEDIEKTRQQVLTFTEKKSKEVSGVVMGEATKRIVPLASKSAELAADYVYQNTVEEVIKRLIKVLPERRQKAIEDWLKKN